MNNNCFSFTREAGLDTRTAHGNKDIYDRLDFVGGGGGYGIVYLCDHLCYSHLGVLASMMKPDKSAVKRFWGWSSAVLSKLQGFTLFTSASTNL